MIKEQNDEVIEDLRKSLAWLDLVLASLKEGVLTLDKNWKVHFANDAIAAILETNRIFLLGSTLWDIVPLSQKGKLTKKIHFINALKKADVQTLNGLYDLVLQDKTLIVDVIFGYVPKIEQIVVVIRDVTKLHQEPNYVKFHQEIAVAANESKTFEEAMQVCLNLICTHTKWPIGHVYYVKNNECISTDIWYLEHRNKFSAFRRKTETLSIPRSRGLPGRVLSSAEPSWIPDVNFDKNFIRAKHAKEAGIKSGIAFPVLIGEEVVAVLEFFSTDDIHPDEALLEVMGNIGTQLGRVVERKRNEQEQIARAEAEKELAERRRAEEQLKMYLKVLESMTEGVSVSDEEGIIHYTNPAEDAMFGYKRGELIGKHVSVQNAYPLQENERIVEDVMAKLKKNGLWIGDWSNRKKDGTIFTTHAHITLIKVKGKKHFVCVQEDTTEQKKAEKLLRESEERFRTLIEQSTDAIQLVSPQGKIIYSSESIKNVLGYTPEELEGQGVNPFMHPDDVTYFNEKVSELLQKPNGRITLEYRVKHKDGSWAWLETTGVNHLNTPNIEALVGTFRNITERKKHEEELRYQKSLLEAQREVSPEGVMVVSPAGKMVSYNKRFVQMWEFPDDLMAKGHDNEALENATQQLENPDEFIKRVQELYANHQTSYEELHFKDGRVFDRYGSPIIGEDGKDYGYVWFFQDITQRKKLERQKDDFIGIASHELKTPVTSIKAYTQVLHNRLVKEGNTKLAEHLAKVDGQLNKLTNLIGDLLDATKIDGDKMQFQEGYFDFAELVTEIIDEMQRTTGKHHIVSKLAKTKTICGDRDRIGQVITNLLTNAIKYSPNASEIIVKTNNKADTVVLSVQDFGIGIPKENKDKVFERFYRVEERKNHETYAGLGLGLYISAEIIKRQNGKIWVQSVENSGSTFSFSLPLIRK